MIPATDSRTRLETPMTRRPAIDIVRSPAAPPRGHWARLIPPLLVGLALVAGVGLRVLAYARNPSLWIDEAMLALNILYRGPAELFEPLDMNQGAPVGFLLAAKACVAGFGGNEFSLRLIPFAASLAGVVLFGVFAYRALPLTAARYAVALFALSPYLAGYAAEFKQYGLDATIGVGLLLLGRRVWNGPAPSGRLVGLALAGAVAVWFSHPAVFVLGGVGLSLLGDAAVRRDRAGLAARCLVVGAWLASFAACYVLVLRRLGTNAYLLDYWAGSFLPLPPRMPGDLAWMVDHFFQMFNKPGGLNGGEFGLAGLAGLCFLVGCLGMARDDWRLLAAVVVPIGFCLLASGLRKYPFAGRLLLFAVPLLIVGVARGLAVLTARLGEWQPGAGLVALAVVFVGPVAECYELVKKPLHGEDAREVLAHASANWAAGDRMYVYYGAVPAFQYYRARSPIPEDAVAYGAENRKGDPRRFRDELQAFRGCGRVWVFFAHRQSVDETAIRAYLDGMGTGDVVFRRSDALLMCYDLRTPTNGRQ